MARESCNLDKDEAEVLKPTSSSTSPIQACPEKANFPGFLPRKPNPVPDSNPEKPTSGQKRKADEIPEQIRSANRCLSCRRKVGLTGFRCRCGELFCPRHRYSDAHGCSFDYKAAGREEIAKANPVVRPPKIIRI